MKKSKQQIFEEIADAQTEASQPKRRLMQIANALYEMGYHQKARSLETIIGRLEAWQNSR